MSQWVEIRHLYLVEGVAKKRIARRLQLDIKTVRRAAMAHRDTSVSALCRELWIKPVTLYRYVGPQGQLREQGEQVFAP